MGLGSRELVRKQREWHQGSLERKCFKKLEAVNWIKCCWEMETEKSLVSSKLIEE